MLMGLRVMFHYVEEVWTALSGVMALPTWAVAGTAVFLLLVLGACSRNGNIRPLGQLTLVVVLLFASFAGWLALDQLARRDFLAEQRDLDQRAFDLSVRTLAPGSPLACLDAIAGDSVEEACEKALFAAPEATAAAVSYVADQLSLLAASSDYVRRGGAAAASATLRRAIEADRFGIAAHVLAARDGCTSEQCGAFFLLKDASRISANLATRRFNSYVEAHKPGWQADGRPAAARPEAAAPVASATAPNNLYFPSSKSIPPVNIMTAEPPSPQDLDKPQGKPQTKSRGSSGGASARKPVPSAQPTGPIAGGGPARTTPTQLGPVSNDGQ